MKETTKN